MSTGETAVWDILAGIPFIAQIKTKVKKGERPSLGEALILVLYWIVWGLSCVVHHLWKWVIKGGGKVLLRVVKWSFKKLADSWLGKTVMNILGILFALLMLGVGGWGLWDGYHNGWTHPVKVAGIYAEAKLLSCLHRESTPIPTTNGGNQVPSPAGTGVVQSNLGSPQSGTGQLVASTQMSTASVSPTSNLPVASVTALPALAISPAVSPVETAIPTVEMPTATPVPHRHKKAAVVSQDSENQTTPAVTPMETAPAVKTQSDGLGQAASSIAQQVGADAAVGTLKHLIGF
jgi:hypothetical protein